jgi:O-methyltransferase involved in polyketide biosynthesis
MDQSNSSVRNISDTARWVAYFRARETQRPDALFRDPFAERLAGERGFEIANTLAQGNKHEWAWVARTYLFDEFLSREIQEGSDLVVNLAAGLDSRPYRMDLPPALQWVEVDLPEIVSYKEEVLGNEKPKCRLERISLDLSDVAGRRTLFAELDRRAKNITVVTEGLLIYFSAEEVASLAGDLSVGEREFLRALWVEADQHSGFFENRRAIGSGATRVAFAIARTNGTAGELSVDRCLLAQKTSIGGLGDLEKHAATGLIEIDFVIPKVNNWHGR